MKSTLAAALLLTFHLGANAAPKSEVSYDYCSLSHSTLVMDRVDQEVLPIFQKHNVKLRNACPFHYLNLMQIRDQVTSFSTRKMSSATKHECPKCRKQFKSPDYVEYHMKM